MAVDQAPLQRALGAHALDQRAEDVGVIAPNAALVGDAGEPARARQHAEQRHFGQADRRRAVVGQPDLVAGERQLVAAAGRRAVARGDELEPGVAARVLDAVARLVGELAEVDLPPVRRRSEHEDVRAGAEHALLAARHDHAPHFGMLEAYPLQRVGKLDVDAEVVGIELELVAGIQAAVLVDVQRQRRDRAVERELPVRVAVRVRVVRVEGLRAGCGCLARRVRLPVPCDSPGCASGEDGLAQLG